MTASRQFFGYGPTVERHSFYGSTPDLRCKSMLDGDDRRFIDSVATFTYSTVGTKTKSVSSKQGTNGPHLNGGDIEITSTR